MLKKKPAYRVAVVGATGAVGTEMIQVLEERKFPVESLHPLASARSAGGTVSFHNADVTVKELGRDSFDGIDVALFSAGSDVSREYAPIAAKAGAVVIDNSAAWRMDKGVPLVVPEVNAHDLAGHQGIIANPNCSTIQMVVALKPLHDLARIKRVVVATYQSTSGAGKDAMDELFNQTRGIYAGEPADKTKKKFTKQIAFNVIPHIDVFMDDGSTKEEWKMVEETKKIMDPGIAVTATCVRVPVFIGHAEAINLEFERPISEDQARAALKAAPGVVVVDHRANEGYVTPVECAGEDAVYVSRIRRDPTVPHGLSLWVVSDNLRKGAALNAVQIAEVLAKSFLRKAA